MNETERDPRVDAAWRAASRDEPPAALDDAIRAAARRAVESAPRRGRDKHWWYPLAAAATVAVIAVGLLQLTPPERVAPATIEDAPRVAKQEAASAPAAPAPSPHSNAVASSAPPPAGKKESRVDEYARGAGGAQSAQKPQRQLDTADKLAQTTEQDSARNAAVPQQPPPVAALARRSEPFPAAAPPPVPSAAGAVTGAPLEARRLQAQAPLAKDALQAPSKSKTAARSVDDWIKLIRQLRSEGRFDEATKEIAAFRSAYGESAESLLPADLRAVTPAAPAAGAKP